MMGFSLHLKIEDADHEVEYDGVDKCLSDEGLRSLFDCGAVDVAEARKDGRRVVRLPAALATWELIGAS